VTASPRGEAFEAIRVLVSGAGGEIARIQFRVSVGVLVVDVGCELVESGEEVVERLRFTGRHLEDVVVGGERCGAFVGDHVG